MPRLADGSINAVLSSGDGGAGRKLWEYLPHFTEITYSLPLSVASVNQAVYDGLDPNLRETVDAAGRQTETELWLALSTRLQETMRDCRHPNQRRPMNRKMKVIASSPDAYSNSTR
jgi:TRAP-type C4-dicarboxylate transport system substrate-binding protein